MVRLTGPQKLIIRGSGRGECMELDIDGRVALVTGSARGMGRTIAESLLEEGCSVVICDLDEEALSETASELRETGDVLDVQADVTDPDDVDRLVKRMVDVFGTVDILVNNVGILGSESPLHEIDEAEWEAVYDVNVKGAVRVTKACLPHMREQGWGRIINIASEAATQPDAFKPHYDSSKAAIVNFTKNLSKTYGKEGILVNAVSPATTYTPMVQELLEERAEETDRSVEEVREEFVREEKPNVVLERLAKPKEIANVVAFLASERASYITGSNYRVDGGSVGSINI